MTQPQPDLAALFAPENRPNPYPTFGALREASPFAMLEGGLVVLGRHADCARVLRDPAMSSNRANSRLGAFPQPANPGFLSMDAPDHTRLRKLVAKAFSPRVIAALEPRVHAIVDDLLLTAAEHDRIDIVSELGYPLPVRIISELLGVPAADQDLFGDWSRRLVHGLDPQLLAGQTIDVEDVAAARKEFADYFHALAAERRRQPGEDLLSRLVQIEEDGDSLTGDELVSTCILLLVAGHETTTNLIVNGVHALLRNPDRLAALRDDPSRAPAVVEEVLRYDPPVQLTSRVTRSPVQIGAVDAPENAMLLVLIGAANRDPAVFSDPERFDDTRPNNAQHLSFAAGPHFCLGAGLARLEGAIALAAVAGRIADPELVSTTADAADPLSVGGVSFRPHVNLRGPERLQVAHSGIKP